MTSAPSGHRRPREPRKPCDRRVSAIDQRTSCSSSTTRTASRISSGSVGIPRQAEAPQNGVVSRIPVNFALACCHLLDNKSAPDRIVVKPIPPLTKAPPLLNGSTISAAILAGAFFRQSVDAPRAEPGCALRAAAACRYGERNHRGFRWSRRLRCRHSTLIGAWLSPGAPVTTRVIGHRISAVILIRAIAVGARVFARRGCTCGRAPRTSPT